MEEIARLEIKAVSDDLVKANKRLDALEKQAPKTERKVDGLGKTLGKFVSTAALVAAATTAMWSAFDNVRSGQKLDAMLKTATGSAEGARIAMSELSAIAKEMPETLEDLTGSFVKLENLGLDSGERALISYGDTASAMGKRLNDFIEAVADATTGEFERLKEFGIKASSEGNKVALTFRGQTTRIGKNAEEIEEYLIRLGETNFAGSMAEQMDTIDGKLSNLSDSWYQFTNALANSEGFIKAIGSALEFPAKVLDNLTIAIRERGLDLANATIADIATLEQIIARNEANMRPARLGAELGDGSSRLELERLQRENEVFVSTLDRLKLQERMLKDADGWIDNLDKQFQGHEAILRIEKQRMEFGLTEGEKLDLQRINNLEEIRILTEQIKEGEYANLSVVEDRILKLEEENQLLTAKKGKLAIDVQNKYQSFYDDAKTELEVLQDKQASELAYVQAHKDLLFANEEQYQIALTELEKKHDEERKALRKTSLTGWLGDTKEFFDELKLVNQGESEELFRIQKGLALADAVVKGAQATSTAYATGGPFPANLIAAAKVAALNAVQVETIRSTEFAGNYTDGGILGGNHFYGDRMSFNGNRGEMVLNYPQQKELFEIANGKKPSGQSSSKDGLNIEVHNYSGERVKTERSIDGQTIRFIVGQAVRQVNAEIADGQGTAKTMEGVYGLRRGVR